MGYDNNTQTITAPVDMGDISTALGVDSLDIKTLCESDAVNKWSRRKPVRRPELGELADTMFEGTASDMADNIHYGIKITGSTSAEIGPPLVQIHDADFEYIRPLESEGWPMRMLDFDGYKHNALPNPGASFQLSSRENGVLTAYYNDGTHQYGSLGGIVVQYDATNTYGVDFSDMYRDTAESLENALKRSYPCILVTDSTGVSYFTALDHPNDGQPAARPLYYNGIYQKATNWSVRFDKPRLNTGISGSTSKPWSSIQVGMRATLFLVKSADIYGPYLDLAKTQNFAENWVPIVNPLMISGKPIVLPADAIGAPLALAQYGAARVSFEPTGVRYNAPFLTIDYSQVGVTSETVTVRFEVRVSGSSVTATRTNSISPNGAMVIPSFQASDFGLLTFAGGGEYTVQVTIKTTDSQGTSSKSGTYYFSA